MDVKRTEASRQRDGWVLAGLTGMAVLAVVLLVLDGPLAAAGSLLGAAGAAAGRLQVDRSCSVGGRLTGLALMLLGASALLNGFGADPARAFGLAAGLAIAQGAACFSGEAGRAG